MTLQTSPDPLGPAASLPNKGLPSLARERLDQSPWWKVPMVWVVISGPLSVVIASLLTAVIAWRHIDPVIIDSPIGSPSRERPMIAPRPSVKGSAGTLRPAPGDMPGRGWHATAGPRGG